MARKKTPTLTEGELKIMQVLWPREEVSVADVTDILSSDEKVAYNTVQTMLKILERKGYVEHRKAGRAFLYRPAVSRESARLQALRYLLRQFFNNEPKTLVQSLLADETMDLMEIEKLRHEIQQSKPTGEDDA